MCVRELKYISVVLIVLLDFFIYLTFYLKTLIKKKKLNYRLTHALCIILCVCSSLALTRTTRKKSLLCNALKTSCVCIYLLRMCLQFICNDSDHTQKSLLLKEQGMNLCRYHALCLQPANTMRDTCMDA